MTLDEAIKFHEETAEVSDRLGFKISMNEHRQLAEWLKELKQLRNQTSWIPVSEKLPKERINSNTNDFEFVLCSTIWDDVRFYKFGKPIGENKAHFWDYGSIMDEYIIAWMYLPESYKEK